MDFYVPQVHEGVVAYAVEAGWWGGLSQLTLPFQTSRVADRWDGILTLAAYPDLILALQSTSSPTVQMYAATSDLPAPAVVVDWTKVGALGARHLLERGYPQLAFYMKSRRPETLMMRDGFMDAARSAGLKPIVLDRMADQPDIDENASTALNQVPWLATRLADLPRPVGVMAEDDRFAISLISACLSLDLSVPDDVAVLGADNDPRRVQLSPHPISSVDPNLFQVGYQAASLLDRLMEGRSAPEGPIVIPPRGVVVRESTDTYAGVQPDVRAAYAYLRQHFREKNCASLAAQHSSTPARTLQSRFKKATGRTLSQEITRLRLEHARHLLEQTQLKLTSVAHETGFASYAHFSGLFERTVGMKPSVYRETRHRLR